MAVGATGVVSVLSNALPAAVVELVASAASGDFAAARTQHYKLLPLFKACFVDPNPTPIKKCVHAHAHSQDVFMFACLFPQGHAACRTDPLCRCASSTDAHAASHTGGSCVGLQGARRRLWNGIVNRKCISVTTV